MTDEKPSGAIKAYKGFNADHPEWHKFRDLAGMRFCRLLALQRVGTNQQGSVWRCLCDCGKKCDVGQHLLRSGKTKSCGCLQKEMASQKLIKHNGRKKDPRLYRIWQNMKNRCYNKNDNHFIYYGMRGIDVCDEWRNNFAAFREWSKDNGYEHNLTIDRIDNDKGYFPSNCRWVSMKIQNNNRRKRNSVKYGE